MAIPVFWLRDSKVIQRPVSLIILCNYKMADQTRHVCQCAPEARCWRVETLTLREWAEDDTDRWCGCWARHDARRHALQQLSLYTCGLSGELNGTPVSVCDACLFVLHRKENPWRGCPSCLVQRREKSARPFCRTRIDGSLCAAVVALPAPGRSCSVSVLRACLGELF